LVSYVKENKTWEGSGERLVEFWEYLSTQSYVENIPYFTHCWDSWHRLDKRIASGESARRYFCTKEFILKGVPNVFIPKIPLSDNRFFDPSNTWYSYDNRPLKESLEKFAKFPISTSFENDEPRLLLVAVDVQEVIPVVFDSYEKEDGTRKSEYGRYGRMKFGSSAKNPENNDRTQFDENVALLMSDFATFAKSLIRLAEEMGVSKEALQRILTEKTKGVYLVTGKQVRYGDLLKWRVDVDFVARLERKNDSHTISNKTFDFSKTTIRQLVQDGYKETKEQMKELVVRIKKELS
jgi:hypothetical protein